MNPVLAQAMQANQANAQASVNTTDEFISVPVTNQRGQPTGQYQQVPNPNYQKPTVDPALANVAPNTAATNTPVLASDQQQQAQQQPATSVPPMLSNQGIQPQQGALQRPTAPNAPTYGGNVGAQMFARSQAAAAQGGPAMLAGMAQGYNEGKQSQYNADLNTYNAEMKQYEDGVARYDAAVKKQDERRKAFQKEISPLYAQVDKLRNAKSRLYNNPNELKANITGMFESKRISDLMTNDPAAAEREVTRKILNDLGVDYTLLKTAKTKGAISDREMAMFASGTMSMNNSEAQWAAWIDGQIEAMATVIQNLEEIESGVRQPYARNDWANVDSLISGSSPQQSNSQPASSNQSSTTIKIEGIPEGAVKQIQ